MVDKGKNYFNHRLEFGLMVLNQMVESAGPAWAGRISMIKALNKRQAPAGGRWPVRRNQLRP
jgi:hypothetical protein